MYTVAALAGLTAVLLPYLLQGGGVMSFEAYVVFPLYATAWDNMQPVVTLLLASVFGAMLGLRYHRHWFAAGNALLILHFLWALLNTMFGPEPIRQLPAFLVFSYFILVLPGTAGAFVGARMKRIFPNARSD